MDYFTIELFKDFPVYIGGENLKGAVRLLVKERFKINAVKLQIKGESYVYWKNRQGYVQEEETYINTEIFFLKKDSSDLYLNPGNYEYPFDIILPQNLPTSFEHRVGKIRYSMKGTIDIPWAFDKYTERSFSVLNHLDLNLNPSYKQSYGVSKIKDLGGCGPCATEPIHIDFNVVKTGYVPGESIIFNATIDNKTSYVFENMSVSLLQRLKFMGRGKTNNSFRDVASVKFPNRNSDLRIKNGKLLVPSVCSTTNTRLIKVTYELVFKFDKQTGTVPKEDTELIIPVTIGTLPIKNEQQTAPVAYKFEASVFNPERFDNQEEKKGEAIESDADTFKPFYPYYKDYSIESN